ncbi:ARPP-1 family domain-containing protein [Microbacterium sp. A93]|uniref:ARPP-1 family domain-containing protein n=1 Tax=Microbacterium sp. A93 TaxID=3450716 RepID=UPI003F426FC1
MLDSLHLGRGTTRGALTVFPVWGEGQPHGDYATMSPSVQVSEMPTGPQVGTLVITNSHDGPLLLTAGELLEGGHQHRMVADSVLLPPQTEQSVAVVCVEHGRWSGGRDHRSANRRASTRIRAGLRAGVVGGTAQAAGRDRQGEVWSRIDGLERQFGASATSSYLDYADRADEEVAGMIAGLRPFPGQVGVMVGIAGHPVFAEVFDRPEALAQQFGSVLQAAAFDAIGHPPVPTPSHRGRRFLELAAAVPQRPTAPAGLARRLSGGNQKVEVEALDWMDHQIHALLTNPRHAVLQPAG